ncbi:N6-mAMP deaminase-like [Silene latifolia]|uniref:N6-mAMP deaminase-like n=1 Tax=Silene latifolia TaxID=37657 RepID=UPI003D78A42C
MRRNEVKGMMKRFYVEAFIDGLGRILEKLCAVDIDLPFADIELEKRNAACMNNVCNVLNRKAIYVRLLLSIDRRDTLEGAMETGKISHGNEGKCMAKHIESIFEKTSFLLLLQVLDGEVLEQEIRERYNTSLK